MALLNKLRPKTTELNDLTGIEFKEGDLIDQRYLVRDVRRGFMGLVYIARDVRSNQPVALKTFQRKFTWVESAIANFTREAEVWMRLGSHPNIVQATRILNIAGRPHIVMEFVPGGSLRHILRRGRVRFQNILDYSIQICRGMQYAYDYCSIIHRDLKPDNVMITPDGIAKVTDFGLAQAVGSRKTHWGHADATMHEAPRIVTDASDLFGGSQPYMSPEQRVQGAPLGPWSDVYSMGVMLYEMMVGDVPFKASTVEELTRLHCEVDPPIPSVMRSGLRHGCDHVILRCLAKKPVDRYESFAELEADLQWLRKYHIGAEYPPLPARAAGDEAAYWNGRGVAHMSLKEHGEALKCFRKATDIDDHVATYWLNLGMCQLALIMYDEALRTFGHAMKLKTSRDEAIRLWWLRAEAHEYLYQLRDAVDAYKQAIALNDQERRAWLGLGRVYTALALPHEAYSAYERAIKLDKNDPQTHAGLGRTLLTLGNPKQALRCFDDALRLNPRDAGVWCGKAECLWQLKRLNEAQSAYETAYKLDPHSAEAVTGLARVRGTGNLNS